MKSLHSPDVSEGGRGGKGSVPDCCLECVHLGDCAEGFSMFSDADVRWRFTWMSLGNPASAGRDEERV